MENSISKRSSFPLPMEKIAGAQLSSLLQYAQDWDDLKKFVNKQWDRAQRNLDEGYKEFYGALKGELDKLEKRAKQLASTCPGGQKQWNTFYASELAREYIRHLVAHLLFVGKGGHAKPLRREG